MVIAARGPSILTPLLAEAIQHAFQTFDDAADGIGEVVEEAVETYSGLLAQCSIGSSFDFLMAGWSESRDCGEVYGLSSIERPSVPAWAVQKVGQALISPDDGVTLMERLKPHVAKLNLATNDPLDVGLLMIEAQRHISAMQGGDRPVHGVGAFAQATTVTRDGISSRILRRWPDAIGVPLQPVPATHDDDGARLLPWYGDQIHAVPAPTMARPAMSREQMRRLKQRRAG